jgi:hypothetical protein
MPYLGASLSTLALVWSGSAQAQSPFADVKPTHWAYQAVTELQAKGIIKGYPNGYFQGQRTLTRYEFAVALQRALATLPAAGAGKDGATGATGATGTTGETGAVGPVGPPGMTPDEVTKLMNLTEMFQKELSALGMDINQIKARLDALGKRVDAIENRLDRMVKVHGDFLVGYRNDSSKYNFFDYSGAARANNQHIGQGDTAIHDFHLELEGNAGNGVKFHGDFVSSNYLSYRGETLSGGPFAGNSGAFGGLGGFGLGGFGSRQVNTLYEANVTVPVSFIGSNTVFTAGRYKQQVTPLTMYRPDYDAYFDTPWYDDGNYVQDGFKLSAKFGSVTSAIWTGVTSSVTTDAGAAFSSPVVGATGVGSPFGGFGKPIGLVNLGQITSQQNTGVHIGIPIMKTAELGLTLIDFSEGNANTGIFGGGGFGGFGVGGGFAGAGFSQNGSVAPFDNVIVYGANLKVNPIGRLTVNAEGSKSVTQVGIDRGDGQNNEDNNAYLLNLGYNTGPLTAQAGYQYIDPRFQAPGYWNKIGNWYNPTNVRGPYVRLGYNFTKKISAYAGADYLEGARNRPGIAGSGATGFTIGDNIYRATAGLKFHLNKFVTLNGAYEGVMYDLGPGTSLSGVRARPTEQYITVGAGLNLTGNTVLKMDYQMGTSDNQGGGFATSPVFGNNGHSNFSTITTSLGVHF